MNIQAIQRLDDHAEPKTTIWLHLCQDQRDSIKNIKGEQDPTIPFLVTFPKRNRPNSNRPSTLTLISGVIEYRRRPWLPLRRG